MPPLSEGSKKSKSTKALSPASYSTSRRHTSYNHNDLASEARVKRHVALSLVPPCMEGMTKQIFRLLCTNYEEQMVGIRYLMDPRFGKVKFN